MRAVISVVGKDRPGILAFVANNCAVRNINIVDVTQKVLQDLFTMIMIVDIFIEIGRCLNMTFVCSLKAAGAYIFPLLMGLLCNWGLGLTTGWLVGVYMGVGVAGIFAGTATDECIRGLIVMYYWYKKKWVGKSVVDKQKKNVLEEEAGS